MEEFMETQTDKSTWTAEDWFMFDQAQLRWFKERGAEPMKVCAEPGDLILWDSRLIHYGAGAEEESTSIRTVVYCAMTPARLISKEALEMKKRVFEKWGNTTHWPHDNIVMREVQAIWEDGTRDPKDRDEPIEKPKMSERLLKLTGVMAY